MNTKTEVAKRMQWSGGKRGRGAWIGFLAGLAAWCTAGAAVDGGSARMETILEMQEGKAVLGFESGTGLFHRVFAAGQLTGEGNWRVTNVLGGAEGWLSWTDAAPGQVGFYRVEGLRWNDLADSDGDGLPDAWEMKNKDKGFNPLNPADGAADEDGDELTNGQEFWANTDWQNADTDDDGMPDGWEVAHGLLPLDPADKTWDEDKDGLTNLQEYEKHTNPRNADSDGDGMPDGWEVDNQFAPLNPADGAEDADLDGLTNAEEYDWLPGGGGTNPRNPDCDGDDLKDGEEREAGTDPWNQDTDSDGLPDGWEAHNGLDARSDLGMGPDLAAWWTFDEGQGSIVSNRACEGKRWNGKLQSTGTAMAPANWTTGRCGRALWFNGEGQFVRVSETNGDGTVLDGGPFTVTWVCKYEAEGAPPKAALGGAMANPTNGWRVRFEGEGRPLSYHVGNGTDAKSADLTDAAGLADWTDVALAWDGEKARGYVNGKAVYDGEREVILSDAKLGEILIGACQLNETSSYWKGWIDDMRIYRRALSEDELAEVNDWLADPDGDGLTNAEEWSLGTNPKKADSDHDGLPDKWEVEHKGDGFNPTDPKDGADDPDEDRLTNAEEYTYGTRWDLWDTDGDDLSDWKEVKETYTDPLQKDTDGDGLPDKWEWENQLDANSDGGMKYGLAAWWKLDGDLLNAADTNKWPGAVNGTNGVTWGQGRGEGKAMWFGGQGQFVRVSETNGDGTVLDWGKPFTLTWVCKYEAEGAPKTAALGGEMATSAKGWRVRFENDIRGNPLGLLFSVAGIRNGTDPVGQAKLLDAAEVSVLSDWTDVALVWDGTNAWGYLNGRKSETRAVKMLPANLGAVWIGGCNMNETESCWRGWIDDVRFFQRVLTADELAEVNDWLADPDGDGLTNAEEWALGTDPKESDSDHDGLPDEWEVEHKGDGFDPTVPEDGADDPDEDGLTNAEEYIYGTRWDLWDTDGDDLNDWKEVKETHTDPLQKDTDGDGLPDKWEWENQLDANSDGGRKYDLAAWWKMDGDLLNAADTNTWPGVVNGTKEPTWGPGRGEGTALWFDGQGQFVRVSLTNGEGRLLERGQPFTVTWVCKYAPEGAPANASLGGEMFHPTNGWRIRFNGKGSPLSYHMGNGTGAKSADLTDAAGLSDWTDVALTWDGRTARGYVNGKEVPGSAQEVLLSPAERGELLIGGCEMNETSSCWNGWIDDVRIYRQALSEKELAEVNDWLGDPDGDGLTNAQEWKSETDPKEADSDHDGLPDKWEVEHKGEGFDPWEPQDGADDPDEDGLTNAEEYIYDTRWDLWDTDGDDLNDRKEVKETHTDPLQKDTDGDGLPDKWELDNKLNANSDGGKKYDLAAWWKLDGDLLNAADTNKWPGAVNGTNGVTWGQGRGEGKAMWFGGQEQFVRVSETNGDGTVLDWEKPFTLTWVCKYEAEGAPKTAALGGASTLYTGWRVRFENDIYGNPLGLLFSVGGTRSNATAVSTTVGQASLSDAAGLSDWTDVALVWDGTNAWGYLNGRKSETRAVKMVPANLGKVWIGGCNMNERESCWRGWIDDVRFYQRVLTADELAEVNDWLADPDGDGLTNAEEWGLGTDPKEADSDHDGLPDKWEVEHKGDGFDPMAPEDGADDPDEDGLTNAEEYTHGTRWDLWDTDGDDLNDKEELEVTHTDPLQKDTDGDGLDDKWEWENQLEANSDGGKQYNLAAWWKLDGDLLNAVDTNKWAGVMNGTKEPTWGPGRGEGKALWFDGQGQFVRVPETNGDGTVLDWEKPFTLTWVCKYEAEGAPKTAALGGEMATSAKGWRVRFENDIRGNPLGLLFSVAGIRNGMDSVGQAKLLDAMEQPVLSDWTDVALVWDGTNAWGYLNGRMSETRKVKMTPANLGEVWIGGCKLNETDSCWRGWIDDVRFFQQVLTTNELAEVNEWLADPDGDGLTNAEEKDFGTKPKEGDSDNDGLPDKWEVEHKDDGFDPMKGDDGGADWDTDGLTNAEEWKWNTNPREKDTDGDGLDDSEEVMEYKTDPLKGDTDADGLGDAWEVAKDNGTDPLSGMHDDMLPLVWLTFDEMDGSEQEFLANRADKRFTATMPTKAERVAGVRGGALRLNGTNFLYVMQPAPGTLLGTNGYTVSMWIRSEEMTGGFRTLLSDFDTWKEADGHEEGRGLAIREVVANNWLQVAGGSPGNGIQRANVALWKERWMGKWTHLAAVHDGKVLQVYLDGSLYGEIVGPATVTENMSLLLGHAHVNGQNSNWKGALDDVRIFGRALSRSEIATLVEAESDGDLTRSSNLAKARDEERNLQKQGVVAGTEGSLDVTVRLAEGTPEGVHWLARYDGLNPGSEAEVYLRGDDLHFELHDAEGRPHAIRIPGVTSNGYLIPGTNRVTASWRGFNGKTNGADMRLYLNGVDVMADGIWKSGSSTPKLTGNSWSQGVGYQDGAWTTGTWGERNGSGRDWYGRRHLGQERAIAAPGPVEVIGGTWRDKAYGMPKAPMVPGGADTNKSLFARQAATNDPRVLVQDMMRPGMTTDYVDEGIIDVMVKRYRQFTDSLEYAPWWIRSGDKPEANWETEERCLRDALSSGASNGVGIAMSGHSMWQKMVCYSYKPENAGEFVRVETNGTELVLSLAPAKVKSPGGLELANVADKTDSVERERYLDNWALAISAYQGYESYFLNETALTGIDEKAWDAATYSEAGLAWFREYTAMKYGDEYADIKFPLPALPSMLTDEWQGKTIRVDGPLAERAEMTRDPDIWAKWWEWREVVLATEIAGYTRRLADLNKTNGNWRGTVLFVSPALAFTRRSGLNMEQLAKVKGLDWLVMENTRFKGYGSEPGDMEEEVRLQLEAAKAASDRGRTGFGSYVMVHAYPYPAVDTNGVPWATYNADWVDKDVDWATNFQSKIVVPYSAVMLMDRDGFEASWQHTHYLPEAEKQWLTLRYTKLRSPPNGLWVDDSLPKDIMLRWNAVKGAEGYEVEMALDETFSNIVTNVPVEWGSPQLLVEPEKMPGEWFWRARAVYIKRGYTEEGAERPERECQYYGDWSMPLSCAPGSRQEP